MSIQSVDRALSIISLFSLSRPTWGIADISKALNLSQPTVHALVQTLTKRGFLSQIPDTRKYSLGLQMYEYGVIAGIKLKINQIGSGPAVGLVKSTNMTVRIAIMDNFQVVVTLNISPQPQSLQLLQIGPRTPAYSSAMGKAILCHFSEDQLDEYLAQCDFRTFTPHTITNKVKFIKDLEESRNKGYAVDREEYMLGFACIGTAIFDETNKPVGAISLSGEPNFLQDDSLSTKVYEMMSVATEISRNLGHYL